MTRPGGGLDHGDGGDIPLSGHVGTRGHVWSRLTARTRVVMMSFRRGRGSSSISAPVAGGVCSRHVDVYVRA